MDKECKYAVKFDFCQSNGDFAPELNAMHNSEGLERFDLKEQTEGMSDARFLQ